MNICLVIPTMQRAYNGFEYIQHTLKANQPFMHVFRTFIYAHPEDMDMLPHKYPCIPRVSHQQTICDYGIKPDSYAYWRTHLCMDFVYAMTRAMELDSSSEYFAWIEDDVLFRPNCIEVLQKTIINPLFTWCTGGVGATFLLFKRHTLVEFCKSISQHWFEDKPLDWMFDLIPTKNSYINITGHIGRVSSRTDTVITRIVNI